MNTNSLTGYLQLDEWHAGAPDLAVPVGQDDHVLGHRDAPVTLLQYGDYECVSCFDAQSIVKALLQRCARQVRFVFRHFPQQSGDPRASLAAQAAEAAGSQGKFWQMHDLLLGNRGVRDETELTHLALSAGLEVYRFNAELASGQHEDRVRADFIGGVESGVKRTPTFFVDGVRVPQPADFNLLASAVERALECHA